MPLKFLNDSGYSQGMIRDEPSFAIPNGGVYDLNNMLSDQNGMLRQRNATTALVSGSQTAFATSLGWAVSDAATPIEELYGANGKDGKVYSINKTTGAATLIGTPFAANSTIGRPCRHFGFLVFPGGTTRAAVIAGQTSATTFTSAGTTTITAGNPQITLGAPDATTNVKVGAYVLGVTAPVTYAGRVVSIDSASTFSVWPVPTTSLAPTAASFTAVPVAGAGSTNGGVCTTSFQNRLLFGNTFDINALQSSSTTVRQDRRVNYGVLPTETGLNSTQVQTGAAGFIFAPNWPVLNYFDVPGTDPIVALEPIDMGRLLILTSSNVMIFSGNLVTELSTTSPSVTYDIYPFDVTSGCLSDMSVMRTPAGIMWAGAEGVFAYWPPIRRSLAHTGMRNLCEGKILNYWLSLVNTPPFVIHGAAYARNHYFISGTAGGTTWSLCVNLGNNAWTRLTGAGTDIFNGVRRPSTPSQTYALRYWDQTGAAPSMTNGQTVRVETMIDPYTAGIAKLDADGSAVAFSVTTKPIGGDLETQKMFQRGTIRYQADVSVTSAAIAVSAQSKIDASDTSTTRILGQLNNTAPRTITAATNASPIAITTSAAHGLKTDDWVNVDDVAGNTAALGLWRITVTSTTAFTLNGSTGNAAYTSGGTVQKVTETDFALSGLNMGQAASFTIANSLRIDNFELHGATIGLLERAPVMST